MTIPFGDDLVISNQQTLLSPLVAFLCEAGDVGEPICMRVHGVLGCPEVEAL